MEWAFPDKAARALAAALGQPYDDASRERLMRYAQKGRIRSRCQSFRYASTRGVEEHSGALAGGVWIAIERNSHEADWFVGDFAFSGFYVGDVGFVEGIIDGLQLSLDDITTLAIASSAASGSDGPARPLPVRGRGRPPKWDWDGALAALLDQDALDDTFAEVLSGVRTQATLEKFVLAWFSQRNDGHSPDLGDIRRRVRKLLQARRERNTGAAGENRELSPDELPQSPPL